MKKESFLGNLLLFWCLALDNCVFFWISQHLGQNLGVFNLLLEDSV